MKYFLINQSCGPLFIDISNEFAINKLNTTLITGKVNHVQNILNNDIKVIKLNRYNRSSIIKRAITWLLFSIMAFFKIIFCPNNSRWLISTNPPFVTWLSGLLKFRHCKVVLLVYDIYPEVLAASNIVPKTSIIYNFWFRQTQKTYKHADRIICIGNSMAEYLISQNSILKEKIIIIPNWNIINFRIASLGENCYRKQRQAEGKIHILYSGNLGATHDFTTILESANKLKDDYRFVFSIIGEGFQTEKIKRYIENNHLCNTIWETFKPAKQVLDVFLSADVFLITLGSGVEKSSIPSKTYDALAAGSALLVIVPDGSELEMLINNSSAGKCFKPGNVDGVVEWLEEIALYPEKLNLYKKAAKKLSETYSPANAKKYVEILTSI